MDPAEIWAATVMDPGEIWAATVMDPVEIWAATVMDPAEIWAATVMDPVEIWAATGMDPVEIWAATVLTAKCHPGRRGRNAPHRAAAGCKLEIGRYTKTAHTEDSLAPGWKKSGIAIHILAPIAGLARKVIAIMVMAAYGTMITAATTTVATNTNQSAKQLPKLLAQQCRIKAADGTIMCTATTMGAPHSMKLIALELVMMAMAAYGTLLVDALMIKVDSNPRQKIVGITTKMNAQGITASGRIIPALKTTIPRPRQQGPPKWIGSRKMCSGGAKIRSFVSGKYTSSTEDGASRSMETGRASTGMKKAPGVNGATDDLEDLVHSGGTATPIKDVPAGMLSKVIRTTTLT